MSANGRQRKFVRLVQDEQSQEPLKQSVINELSSCLAAARMMETVNVADYVAGADVQSLGGDLMQVKAGIRAVEALISNGGAQDQWFAMLEMLTQKIDTIAERLTVGVRQVRSA